ncbi:MAG: tyrosine-protein phosphatase [Ruminococcus sp.]|nr:tyrosine-protein phosphatase [Ruminococcus sp.]
MDRYSSLLSSTGNTRDLGGYRTEEGITEYNRIWRSDVTHSLTPEDIAFLRENGMTTVIDLRTDEEAQRKSNALAGADGFDYHRFPVPEGSEPPESFEEVPDSYMRIAGAVNICSVFRTIAQAEGGVMIQCNAGKDRTGTVSAILLLAAGVDRDDIIRDYTLTREYIGDMLEKYLSAHPETDRRIILADRQTMTGFLDRFLSEYGDVRTYLKRTGLTDGETEKIMNKLH